MPAQGISETGTQYGFTLASLVATNLFDHLYSVEFADANYKVNVARFQGVPVVKLWKGDSGVLIREMLKESASTPRGAHGAVIWLDAHYTNAAGSPGVTPSEQVPLSRELAHILSDRYASKHMVLMDDLRFWMPVKSIENPDCPAGYTTRNGNKKGSAYCVGCPAIHRCETAPSPPSPPPPELDEGTANCWTACGKQNGACEWCGARSLTLRTRGDSSATSGASRSQGPGSR